MVNYVEQPPTTFGCSPYDPNGDQNFRLRIACRAEKVATSNFEGFDLSWWRKRSRDGTVENLGSGDRSGNDNSVRIVLTGISGLNLAPFSEDMPGDYWCLAVVTNGSEVLTLAPSNMLTVLRPEDYVGRSVCNSVQSVDTTKCADNTQSPSPVTTSFLPSPSPQAASTSLQRNPSSTSLTGQCIHS